MTPDRDTVVVVMGVSGSGKTTIARTLAARLGWDFEEGDALHPPQNIAKMAARHPLTDADRRPWLRAVGAWIDGEGRAGRDGVVACSALKRSYRDVLRDGRPEVCFAFLTGDSAMIAERLAHRHGHFMPSSLLRSQLQTLEPLAADEPGVAVQIGGTPGSAVDQIIRWLAAR